MSKLEFNEVIKLVKELKKNGVLKKKRKRNKKPKRKINNYVANNQGQYVPQSYGSNQINNSSNLNTLIASEQLKLLENKRNDKLNYEIENKKTNDYLNYLNDTIDEHKFLIENMYNQGLNQFNAVKTEFDNVYKNIGFDIYDNDDIATSYGSDQFIPQGNNQSSINYDSINYNNIYDNISEDNITPYDNNNNKLKLKLIDPKKLINTDIIDFSEISPINKPNTDNNIESRFNRLNMFSKNKQTDIINNTNNEIENIKKANSPENDIVTVFDYTLPTENPKEEIIENPKEEIIQMEPESEQTNEIIQMEPESEQTNEIIQMEPESEQTNEIIQMEPEPKQTNEIMQMETEQNKEKKTRNMTTILNNLNPLKTNMFEKNKEKQITDNTLNEIEQIKKANKPQTNNTSDFYMSVFDDDYNTKKQIELEAKPEAKQETKPEAKLETKPEAKLETKQTELDAKPGVKPTDVKLIHSGRGSHLKNASDLSKATGMTYQEALKQVKNLKKNKNET